MERILRTLKIFNTLARTLCWLEKTSSAGKGKHGMSFGNWSGSGLKSPAPLQQQVQLFKASTLSVLLYGSASWVQTSDLCRQLDSFQMSCLRFMIEWEESPFPNQLKPTRSDSWATVYSPLRGTWFLNTLCTIQHMANQDLVDTKSYSMLLS